MPIGLLSKKPKELNKVILLPLDQIESNPYQPRRRFKQEDLQELTASIAVNGLLQPVTVRKVREHTYELVAGERRTMAFRLLGKECIPAIVEEYSDQQSASMALIENLQRKDLNFFEEAAGIERLMGQLNLTQQQVSQKIGKAQSTVANKLRLLRYPAELQERMLAAGLTERHARALLRLEDQRMLELAVERMIRDKLTVEQSEHLVEDLLLPKEPQWSSRLFIVKDMRMFQNSIKKAVTMMNSAGIPVDSKVTESDDYVQYVIKIPKSAIYRNSAPKTQTGAV